jgi:hypothetical protein
VVAVYVICILIQLRFDLLGGEKQESQVGENIGLDFPILSPVFHFQIYQLSYFF